MLQLTIAIWGESSDEDDAVVGIEGERLIGVRSLRRREVKLRAAKIVATPRDGRRLRYEVPNCRFDFEAIYGEIGRGFIHVHHLEDLKGRGGPTLTALDGLMLVCPNCHAMIHQDGACRDPGTLVRRPST